MKWRIALVEEKETLVEVGSARSLFCLFLLAPRVITTQRQKTLPAYRSFRGRPLNAKESLGIGCAVSRQDPDLVDCGLAPPLLPVCKSTENAWLTNPRVRFCRQIGESSVRSKRPRNQERKARRSAHALAGIATLGRSSD